MNEFPAILVRLLMKAIFLISAATLVLANISPAQTCREVVRDSSGRVVQTIERRKSAGGTDQAVIRDASGRITGTATTRNSGRKTTTTEYRDANGRLTGSASTNSGPFSKPRLCRTKCGWSCIRWNLR